VLGRLAVSVDGVDRPLRGARTRDLLAALLLRAGRAVDPTMLLEEVWGEGSGLGVAVVHTQVARLRRDAGSACVETVEAGYRVPAPALDAHRFADLVREARAASTPDDAVGPARAALALWHGDRPYDGVSAGLVTAESVRLLGLRTATRELLADRLLQVGDRVGVEEAAELAEQLVADDPLRERGHELAVLAAARAGRRADALAAYDRLRVTLRDELGLDPGRSAQQLHLQVLRDELGPVLTGP